MNGLDIALVVVLFFFFLRGIFRGFIKEVTGIAGLVVGFYLASRYYPVVAGHIKPFLQNPSYRMSLGFVSIFLVGFFLVGLLGVLLDKLIKLTISNVGNGLLGAVIGLAKGAVLAAVVLLATTAFIRQDTPFFKNSVTWPYMAPLAEYVKGMVPEDLKSAFEQKIETLPDGLNPELPIHDTGDANEPAPWKPAVPEYDKAPAPGLSGGST